MDRMLQNGPTDKELGASVGNLEQIRVGQTQRLDFDYSILLERQ
jgi:hypothetical protein